MANCCKPSPKPTVLSRRPDDLVFASQRRHLHRRHRECATLSLRRMANSNRNGDRRVKDRVNSQRPTASPSIDRTASTLLIETTTACRFFAVRASSSQSGLDLVTRSVSSHNGREHDRFRRRAAQADHAGRQRRSVGHLGNPEATAAAALDGLSTGKARCTSPK